MPNVVLDSFAIIAFYRKESSAEKVKQYIINAENKKLRLFLSYINLAELYYKIIRGSDKHRADQMLSNLRSLPIELVSATDDLVLKAAKIKATYPIALGDCFAISLALEKNATILTGDAEFKKVEKMVKIEWL